ncbi:hypothetical protein TEA_026301 [Camellia sinensis var. sinensis]|uniref:Uncharacterized protein n=1 Tax=Camellia sinensis var. sinensis TaxID=542762 RepID=A0A4S4DCK1_CAMSN|nr:hypothetical protein TEA_026301 [Camellia sinensis var. sinensis]
MFCTVIMISGAEQNAKANTSYIYAGKAAWPELLGAQGKIAAATIEREMNYQVKAVILLIGTKVTGDFVCTRVRVWVDKSGIVVQYVEIFGNVLALRMRGTITFQLPLGELAALRMRGISTFQLAPGELGRGTNTFQPVSGKLGFCYGKVYP